MKELFELLDKKHLTISSVESITGGSFAASLTKIPGASKVFVGSLVTYTDFIKNKILNIDIKEGVINPQTASAMAMEGQTYFGSDLCISFTGNAGPNSVENKSTGLTYIAIKYHHNLFKFSFQSDALERKIIIQETVDFGVKKILDILSD